MVRKLLCLKVAIFWLFTVGSVAGYGQCPSSVAISSDVGNTICEGTTVTYTATQNGGTASTYYYQWKIDGQNQGSPTTNNTFSSSTLTNGQTVSVTVTEADGISCSISNNGSPITVNATRTPTVNFTMPAGTICIGNLKLTATNTNAGSNPTYDWYVDGSLEQSSSSKDFTYNYSTAKNYSVKVVLNSSYVCPSPASVEVTKTVTITPGSTISTSNADLNGVCLNQSITPIVYNIGGSATGASVTGLPPGITGSYNSGTFTISGSPTSDGIFNYNVTTQGPCGNGSQGGIIEVVKDATINLTSGNSNQEVCQGETIVNMVYSIGETGTGASISGLPTGLSGSMSGNNFVISGSSDQTGTFDFKIFATGECGVSSTLNGTLVINENLTPTVSISSSDADNNICEGTSVTFTATPTNGGSNPSYQWKNGNSDVGTNSSTFTTNTLALGDQPVSVILTSSETCLTVPTATSNEIITTVNPNLTPEVTIEVTDSHICPNDEVTFTATPVNAGSSPSYQWKVNGNNVGTNSPTFVTSNIQDGQNVSVIVKSNETCLADNDVESNVITMEVFPPAPATPGAISGETEVCSSRTALVYSVPAVENATNYSWTLPSGWTITAGDGTERITVNAGTGSGDITVTASNSCGSSSSASSLSVTSVDGVPTNPGTISSDLGGNNNICPPYLVSFNVAGSGPHKWTVPTGWEIVSGAGTNSIEVNITNAATSGTREVSVVAQNICGDSSPSVYGNIEINDHIIADFGEDQTICGTVNSIQLSGTRSFGNATLDVSFSSTGTGTFSGSTVGGNNKNGRFTINYTPSAADKASGQVVLTMTVPEPRKQDNTGNDCGESSASVILNIIKDASISAPSNKNQTVCINEPISGISFTITDAGTGATVTGLPAGLNGVYNTGVFTISGTPTTAGTFNYAVNTTGTCSSQQTSTSGTITVKPDNAITDASNKNQTVCINTAVEEMAFPVNSSVTSVSASGLPSGVNGSISGGNFVLSGTPSESGTFPYSLTTVGSCQTATTTGTITVNPDVTISSPENNNQTICINTAIEAIEFEITEPGSGATVSGLPKGLESNYANGVLTISGSPTEAGANAGENGVFNYTVQTTGECVQVSGGGTITVIPDPVASISYPDDICTSITGSINVTLQGTGDYQDGTFSAPLGLTISSSSGAITPGSSTPGTYTITYDGPATCTPAVATTEVTIIAEPYVEFSYDGPFCTSDANLKEPAFTNGLGDYENGSFTSSEPGGLSIDSSTGQIIPQNSSPGTYDVFYTIDANTGCSQVTVQTEVTITQIPQIEISYPEFICSSETSVPVTISGEDGNYENGVYSGTSGLSIGSDGTINPSESSYGAHTVTYTIAAGEGCEEVVATSDFIIKEAPLITTDPVNTGVCSNSPAEFEVIATGDDLTYQWYKIMEDDSEVPIAGEDEAVLSFTNVTAADALRYYVKVTGNNSCTEDVSEVVTLNVDEDIVISEPSEDVTICEDTQEDISFIFKGHANGAVLSFDWYKDGEIVTAQNGKIEVEVSEPEGPNGEYTGTLTIIDPESGENGDSGVYYVIVDGPDYFTCSEATSKTFTFRVDPRPEAPTVVDQQFCLNEDAGNLTATGEDGNSIKWYTLEGSDYTYIGDNIEIDTSEPNTFVYYATQTRLNGCESDFSEPLTLEILDTPDPVATETIEFEFCYEEEVTGPLSITAATGAELNWYDNADNSLETAPIPSTTSVGLTTYYVSQTFTDTGCESDKVAVEVRIKELPNVNVSIDGGENTICLGSSVNFTATGAESYDWYLGEENLQSGTSATFTATPTALGENIYTVIGTADGCTNIYNISVYVDDNTIAGTLTAPERICIADGTAEVSLESKTGSITKWEYKSASTGDVWTETEDIDLNDTRTFTGLTETTSFRVTVKNGVCDEEYSETTVIVDALPEGGELLWAKNKDRLFLTCVNPVPGYASDLNLTGYSGQVLRWEYRGTSATSWSAIESTEPKLTADQIEAAVSPGDETTVFRAILTNHSCDTGISSKTALVSVIQADIKPSPVEVDKEVVCIGDEITLSSQTGYSSTGGKFEGGQFTEAGIKNKGWRFTNPSGGSNDYDAAANNGRADHWLKMNASGGEDGKVYTGTLPTGDTGTTIRWTSIAGVNEKFALVTGNNDSYMETPVFSLNGMDEAVFTWDQGYNLTAGATITVEISLDGGNSYETILYTHTGDGTVEGGSSGYYTDFGGGNPTSRPKNKMVIDLGNYLGQSNLRIRFNYDGKKDGDVWAVDNIKVPEGPQDVILQWYYDDDLNDPDNYLEPIGEVNQSTVNFIPRKIGWNDFEVQTRIVLDSNGDQCQSIDNFETIRVWAYDRYTTTVDAKIGACGSLSVSLNATVTAEYQNKTITEYPTLDGYEGSWQVEDLNGNVVTTGFEMSNQDPESTLAPRENPEAVFEAENLGDYVFKWILTPTAVDENGNIIPQPTEENGIALCPPAINPESVTLLDCTTLDFDGVDDYIDLGNNYNGNFFIEVWIRPFDRPLEDGGMTDASKGVIFSSAGFELRMDELSSKISTNDRWYHIAVSNSGELWIDGVSIPGGISINGSGINNTSIGARYNANTKTTSNHFSGWIDELRIWKGDSHPDLNERHFMMNQRIKLNPGANVSDPIEGEIVPNLELGDGFSSYYTKDGHNLDQNGIKFYDQTWGDLAGYYRLYSANPDPDNLTECVTFDDSLKPSGGYTPDHAINKVPGRLVNITTDQENTSPTPYCSGKDGIWADENTWARPDVWDYPNSTYSGTQLDWNIARTRHNITSESKDIIVLGLLSDVGLLSINKDNPLRVTHYLLLNGNIDLVGESQLLQDHGSILDDSSGGWLQRDQQGKRLSFNYNYWSSPVNNQGSHNNSGYTVGGVLRDGTTPSNPQTITFKDGYFVADGGRTNPITISNYWIWKFYGTADTYGDWFYAGSTGSILSGEGYTMKGTDGTVGLDDEQNYVFQGKPHNGNIPGLTIGTGQNHLIGNPYPSAIDAKEFLRDNLSTSVGGGRNTKNVFNGAIYFWDHFDGFTHILEEYIGGYATLNLTASVEAASVDWRINHDNNFKSNKKPGQYIPVGQAFFVNTAQDDAGTITNIDGGNIVFKNTQRIFKTESSGSSVFMSQERKDESVKATSNTQQTQEENSVIWLKFKSPKGYNRQIAVGTDPYATDGFDLGYDAFLIEDNIEDMFWFFENNKFVIQGIKEFTEDKELALGVKISEKGELTIKLDDLQNFPDDLPILLKDELLDMIHDLRKEPYKTTSEAGTFTDRFKIVFKDKTVVEPEPEEPEVEGDFKIMYVNGTREIFIMNPHKLEIDKVYLNNMLGQQVHMFYDIPTKNLIKLPVSRFGSGVYIVKVHSEKGVTTKKVILE